MTTKLETPPLATIDEAIHAVLLELGELRQFPVQQQLDALRRVAQTLDAQLITPVDMVVEQIEERIQEQFGELHPREFNAFVLRLRRQIHDQLENTILAAQAEG